MSPNYKLHLQRMVAAIDYDRTFNPGERPCIRFMIQTNVYIYIETSVHGWSEPSAFGFDDLGHLLALGIYKNL
jgi:hypothetical protein